MKRFYRVCDPEKEQGLWYYPDGTFHGTVHTLDYLRVQTLKMDFDPEVAGWLSCTETLEQLWNWFNHEEIIKLQERGLFIHEYEAVDYKYYERFDHMLIKQDTSKISKKIILS